MLAGIFKVFREMRNGTYDEAELEAQLQARGLMYRFFGRFMRSINHTWQLYFVGLVFGIGFDTATEVVLLAATAYAAIQGLPYYAVLALPFLFSGGMMLFDTLDGVFMNFAYGWAFARPVRKVYYNLVITGLSIGAAFIIGTIEILGILTTEAHLHGGFWSVMANFNINVAGFCIAGLFIAVWAVALAYWRWGNVEARWTSNVPVAPAQGSEPTDEGSPRRPERAAHCDNRRRAGPSLAIRSWRGVHRHRQPALRGSAGGGVLRCRPVTGNPVLAPAPRRGHGRGDIRPCILGVLSCPACTTRGRRVRAEGGTTRPAEGRRGQPTRSPLGSSGPRSFRLSPRGAPGSVRPGQGSQGQVTGPLTLACLLWISGSTRSSHMGFHLVSQRGRLMSMSRRSSSRAWMPAGLGIMAGLPSCAGIRRRSARAWKMVRPVGLAGVGP